MSRDFHVHQNGVDPLSVHPLYLHLEQSKGHNGHTTPLTKLVHKSTDVRYAVELQDG